MIANESTDLEKYQAPLHGPGQGLLYPLLMEMKERLRRARLNAGFKKKAKAAERIGVSPQALGQWEDGDSAPSRENLFKAAEVYRIPVDSLRAGPHPLPEPAPDELEEFKQKLLAIAERVPQAQRGALVKIAETMLPDEPPAERPKRRRAS